MTAPDPEIDRLVSAALLRLRMRTPFFATLALFARVVPSAAVPAAATDGRTIFVNPELLRALPAPRQDELLLHQILHAALLHTSRRGGRDPRLWTAACDIVANNLAAAVPGIALPPDALHDPRRAGLSAEEVYELLLRDPDPPTAPQLDLLELHGEGGAERDSIAAGRDATLETYWRDARQHAEIIALSVAQGSLPAGLRRELALLDPAQLDWRAHLWRYLVATPTDFAGFDRRLIWRGMYLEDLAGESVRAFVAIDTSGSVDDMQIRALAGEVQGILAAYPHVRCELYYADAALYGPYELSAHGEIPAPIGGGGTDFRPFFAAIAARPDPQTQAVCVYLTDGYGDFPPDPPDLPVLWVVTAGGKALDSFPFGEAVRLLSA